MAANAVIYQYNEPRIGKGKEAKQQKQIKVQVCISRKVVVEGTRVAMLSAYAVHAFFIIFPPK